MANPRAASRFRLRSEKNALDAQLLDRVLLKYDWLREPNELRTKLSTCGADGCHVGHGGRAVMVLG